MIRAVVSVSRGLVLPRPIESSSSKGRGGRAWLLARPMINDTLKYRCLVAATTTTTTTRKNRRLERSDKEEEGSSRTKDERARPIESHFGNEYHSTRPRAISSSSPTSFSFFLTLLSSIDLPFFLSLITTVIVVTLSLSLSLWFCLSLFLSFSLFSRSTGVAGAPV